MTRAPHACRHAAIRRASFAWGCEGGGHAAAASPRELAYAERRPAHHSLSFLRTTPSLSCRLFAAAASLPAPRSLRFPSPLPPPPPPYLPLAFLPLDDTSTTRPLTGARAARTSRRCQHARCCCCRARPALPRRRMRRRAAGDVATLPHFSHTTLARARSSTPRHSHATLTPLSPPSYARRFPRRPRETWPNPPRPRPAPAPPLPPTAHPRRRMPAGGAGGPHARLHRAAGRGGTRGRRRRAGGRRGRGQREMAGDAAALAGGATRPAWRVDRRARRRKSRRSP